MAINLTVNGVSYVYPETGDSNWGTGATNWASAVTSGMLQKSGGSFPLTSNVDFGSSFGLVSTHFTSRSSNSASAGALRLSASDSIGFRNQANSLNLPLALNISDQLTFNGQILLSAAYTGITNANIDTSAAIAFSKMAALTASRALQSSSGGVIEVSSVTSTELGYLSGVTSAIQTQLDAKLNLSGGTLTGPLLLASDPTTANQAATKQYVDNAMLGLQPKDSVIAATTANGNLATDFDNGSTLDGVSLVTGNRILIKNQTLSEDNGIYIVAASGAPSRSTDMDDWAETIEAYVLVTGGTTNGGSGWLSTSTSGGTIGTTPFSFVQFSSTTVITTDGEGIELTGNQLSLELDGSTLSKSASGVRVAASVISDIAAKLPITITTTGDLIYSSSGTTASRLGIGSTGQILTVSAGLPSWQTLSFNPTIVSLAGNLTLTSADSNKVILVDCSAARSITLPTPTAGLNFIIKDATGQANTNNISVIRASSEQIEGIAATKILQTNWGSWKIISDGTNWFLIAG